MKSRTLRTYETLTRIGFGLFLLLFAIINLWEDAPQWLCVSRWVFASLGFFLLGLGAMFEAQLMRIKKRYEPHDGVTTLRIAGVFVMAVGVTGLVLVITGYLT